MIARPFVGRYPNFTRTANRHDFSLPPSGPTVLNLLHQAGLETIGGGEIGDIFAGSGLSRSLRTRSLRCHNLNLLKNVCLFSI